MQKIEIISATTKPAPPYVILEEGNVQLYLCARRYNQVNYLSMTTIFRTFEKNKPLIDVEV